MKDHQLTRFLAMGMSVVAFILLIKFLVQFMPEGGIPGTAKSLVMSI